MKHKRTTTALGVIAVLLVTGWALADRADEAYERGQEALDDGQWQGAIDSFEEVIRLGDRRVDRKSVV